MIDITVGIPTLNRYYTLIKTIENVMAQQHPAVSEIIIVDQSDSDVIEPQQERILQSWDASGKISWLKSKRKNLPAARNLILQKAKAEIILFLDDDVILPTSFIDAHYKHYINNSDLIAVAGLNYNRVEKCNFDDINVTNYIHYTVPHHGFETFNANFNDLIGANHSINRRLAFIQGYDEYFIGGSFGEDTDMAKRIVKNRWGRIICDPGAWLIHLRVPSGGCRIKDKRIKRSEFEIVGPFLLYPLRHLNGSDRKNAIINSLRAGPLRKENVVKFWRQSFVWFQYTYAFYWAYKNRNKVKSPFVKN